MSRGQEQHGDDGVMANILFWIGVPLAFGLGMWTSYILSQESGSTDSLAPEEKRQEIRELRRGRARLEKRLRAARKKVSGLQRELSQAKKALKQQDAETEEKDKADEQLKKQLSELREELQKARQANEKLEARLAESRDAHGETAEASGDVTEEGGGADVQGLDILAADAKVTDRNEQFWQYTWRLKLANRGDTSLRLMGQVLFKDKEGSRVSGSPVDCRVEPGQTKTVSGDCMIRSSAAEKVEQLSVTVSEIPGD
ncbi:MAG: hypothetical protein V5A84_04645 [Planctomycetota bacterium]